MSYAFPIEERMIGNYIYEALKDDEPELIEEYDLLPFPMQVQSLERTLISYLLYVTTTFKTKLRETPVIYMIFISLDSKL